MQRSLLVPRAAVWLALSLSCQACGSASREPDDGSITLDGGADTVPSRDDGVTPSPTQLVIQIDSDFTVPVEADFLAVTIVDPSGVPTSPGVALLGFPVRGVTEWSSGPLEPVSVTATLSLGGTTVLTTQVTTGFVAGEVRVLSLPLVRSCMAVACGPMQSCGAGGCSASTIPGEDLPRYDGPLPVESDF